MERLIIEWNLIDGEGVYTSVDIQNAMENGYKIEFIGKCLVYDSKSDSVFTEYIATFFKLKKVAEESDQPVLRAVAKLLLNSLYGKMLQKAIFSTNQIINNPKDFNNFATLYELTDWKELKGGKLLISGEIKIKENQINKPCQLGAFVTAYSRRLMLVYMKAIDPSLTSMIFTYSDTDSLHILGHHYEKLKQLGFIDESDDCELGIMNNDVKQNGLIIKEKNLAPKSYRYEYINKKGYIANEQDCVMKMKGIQTKTLKYEFYDNQKAVVLQMQGLTKKGVKLTKQDKVNQLHHFSISNYKQDRTFYKNPWNTSNFKDNQWYPEGYVS